MLLSFIVFYVCFALLICAFNYLLNVINEINTPIIVLIQRRLTNAQCEKMRLELKLYEIKHGNSWYLKNVKQDDKIKKLQQKILILDIQIESLNRLCVLDKIKKRTNR